MEKVAQRKAAIRWNGIPPYPCISRNDAINRIRLVTQMIQNLNGRTCTIGDLHTKIPVELLNSVWCYLTDFVEEEE